MAQRGGKNNSVFTVYHCGKHPEEICTAATYGNLDTPCAECALGGASHNGTKKGRVTRKEVVALAEKDPEYGRCGTCRHYQRLITCGACCNGSRYSFDWRRYAEEKQL